MRRIVIWFVVLLLGMVAAAQPVQAEPDGQSSVTVDGKSVAFDVEPTVVNRVLMVPIRAVAESLSGEVTWQAESRTAVIQTKATRVELTVGKDVALVNGQTVKLAAPVVIKDDRTLVPASFLLTLFGQKVTVNNPALKDPIAMALLEKGQNASPRGIDLDTVQQTTTVSRVGTEQHETSLTTTAHGQVRGDDVLLETTLQVGGEKIAVTSVIRNGKAYNKLAGQAWQEVPENEAAVVLNQQLDPLQMLVQMIKEAHLGASRTVNGQQQQDVVITFDVAALKAMVDQMIASDPPGPGVQLDVVWENATATLTLDAATGMTIHGVVDTAVNQSITAGSESFTMRMVMHQEITQHPNDQPIVWPADLPVQ